MPFAVDPEIGGSKRTSSTCIRTPYWISGCRSDGADALYPTVVAIDDDVREEYWRTIRGLPERARDTSFRSEGKHTMSRGPSGAHEGARRRH